MKSGHPFSRVLAACAQKRIRSPLPAAVFLVLFSSYQGANNFARSAPSSPLLSTGGSPLLSTSDELFNRNLGAQSVSSHFIPGKLRTAQVGEPSVWIAGESNLAAEKQMLRNLDLA